MSCVHYQYHKDKVIGRKDEGLISVPIVEPAHFECDLGRGKTLCDKFEIQPTPFDGMIAKADEILNEIKKEEKSTNLWEIFSQDVESNLQRKGKITNWIRGNVPMCKYEEIINFLIQYTYIEESEAEKFYEGDTAFMLSKYITNIYTPMIPNGHCLIYADDNYFNFKYAIP